MTRARLKLRKQTVRILTGAEAAATPAGAMANTLPWAGCPDTYTGCTETRCNTDDTKSCWPPP